MGLLRRLGFDICEGEVTAPAPAACLMLKERGLRPHLLVHDGRPAGWALGPFKVGAGGGQPSHLGQTAGKDAKETPASAASTPWPVGGDQGQVPDGPSEENPLNCLL